jgi:hypothetical protein
MIQHKYIPFSRGKPAYTSGKKGDPTASTVKPSASAAAASATSAAVAASNSGTSYIFDIFQLHFCWLTKVDLTFLSPDECISCCCRRGRRCRRHRERAPPATAHSGWFVELNG